uniref:Uncharacterized protein n=1 Tax=Alexandrium monilatum TaxID=311494 RepID=A0A7S4UVK7_9DINO|mmetsp:Transcript_21601/g.64928  ORF Transcript_21601/g.64928 Transcript_21601/m.64928 type:complete len:117 (-) Transcript_21601:12-362(-)
MQGEEWSLSCNHSWYAAMLTNEAFEKKCASLITGLGASPPQMSNAVQALSGESAASTTSAASSVAASGPRAPQGHGGAERRGGHGHIPRIKRTKSWGGTLSFPAAECNWVPGRAQC